MKRIIKLIVFAILLLTVFSFNVFSKTNDFTITIGKKTISLDYFNNKENKQEIIKLIKESNGNYVLQTSECLYSGKICVEKNKIKISDKISKLEYVKEKFNGYKNSLKNENFISTKIEEATIGTFIEIQIDKKSPELKNSYYYQIYDNGKAISEKTKPNIFTTIYPSKQPGDSVDIKFFDRKKNEIKTVTDIIIGEDYISKKNISGIVNLLEDEKNKNTTTKVNISCIEVDNQCKSNYPTVQNKIITLPRGISSANYSFELSRNKNYIIEYEILNKKTKFVPRGYYNRRAVEYDRNYAEVLYLGNENIENIDFTIKPCKTITGKLIVNKSTTIPKSGLHAYITAYIKRTSDNNDYFQYIDRDYVFIQEGQLFTNFSLAVKENENYIISYYFVEDEKFKFNRFGYYNEMNVVSNSINASKIFVSDEDVENVEIKLSEKNSIKGRIFLPEGERAGKGGVNINVYPIQVYRLNGKEKINWGICKRVTIKEGCNSTSYSLYVDKEQEYIVNYSLVDCNSNYIQRGFNGTNGVVYNTFSAEKLYIKDDIKNIDFRIEQSMPIKGKINFSDDYIKTNNIKYVKIDVYKKLGNNDGLIDELFVYVSQYNDSYNIKMNVLKNGEYKIDYKVYDTNQQCVEEKFLGKNGIVGGFSSVQWMQLNPDNKININLSK